LLAALLPTYDCRAAMWYVAEIVERIRVEGDPRAVVHVNFCLVEAADASTPYSKACALGRTHEMEYRNPVGKRVVIKFLGLRELNVVHDLLEDGAELLYSEYIGLSDSESRALVRPRSRLAPFRPRRPSPGPNYGDRDILAQADRLMHGVPRKPRR
jgi:hypothetical protein